MKRFHQLLAAVFFASLFLGCATSSDVASSNVIQKRKYRKGFFIASLNKSKEDRQKSLTQRESVKGLPVLTARNLATASLESYSERQPAVLNTLATPVEIVRGPAKTDQLNFECDIILLTNGDEIEAQVIEITDEVVRYKKCDHLNGPTYIKNRDDIVLISYPDGSKDMFNNEKLDNQRNNRAGTSTSGNNDIPVEKHGDQIVAALLCFFFWWIGVHRFYLGYVGIGILQILTVGGCGIWALIDFIRILTGHLKPKNAEYEEPF